MKNVEAKELLPQQERHILTAIKTSEFASPISPVLKGNGEIRVCVDYKPAINPLINVDTYPLPKVEELLVSLLGGLLFTDLGLARVYLQMQMHATSKKF